MVACYSQRIVAGTPQTEMARIIPDTRPSALLAAVQNRSRRFCRSELTADGRAANPELIRGENCAETLLARIKAEWEKVSIKKGRKVATVD